MSFLIYDAAIVIVKQDQAVDSNDSIDWVDAYLKIVELILFNFV